MDTHSYVNNNNNNKKKQAAADVTNASCGRTLVIVLPWHEQEEIYYTAILTKQILSER